MQVEPTVGIVETKYATFFEPPHEMELECGKKLGPITLAYETYGELNADKSNAILILHALTSDAHVAGRHTPEDRKPGWWDNMVGPGKAFDTNRYYVICSNVIGGCKGSTGPCSINPATGRRYGLDFPVVTIKDMVRAQKQLIDYLGLDKLLCVSGGSLGGMQALQWAVTYPESVKLVIPIATTARLSPQAIAFDAVGRNAIMSDPNWNNGNYCEDGPGPDAGLALARMIGHITYLSDTSMHRKFGRELVGEPSFDFGVDFQVESYLNYQGDSFVKRFDANSYLYITKAMDYFDLTLESGSLENALAHVKSKFQVISFSSDWIFPPYQSEEIVAALKGSNKDVSYTKIMSDYGHDAFLLEVEALSNLIRDFIAANI